MIIKKHHAQAITKEAARPKLVPGLDSDGHALPPDPYQGELAPEDFEAGRLAERRNQDRRQGYRRAEDVELISRAEEEANAIREAAAEEGFQAGLDEAQFVVDELRTAMESLFQAREQAFLSAGDELADMAVSIAEHIIKTEVACDETLVMKTVRDTVSRVSREQKDMTIRVHPVDYNLVKETMKTDSGLFESVEVMVQEDDTVNPGSCTVETRAGFIDARFSTQLEVFRRLLQTGGRA